MKYTKLCAIALSLVASASIISVAHAALVPSLLLSPTSGDNVQIAVVNADPNAQAIMYYPTANSSGSASVILGMTNASGNLSTTVSSAADNLSSGMQVYVLVDGQQSQSVPWPNVTNNSPVNAALALSQTSVTLQAGQSTSLTITSGNASSVSMTNNTNSSVASAYVAGSQVVVNGYNAGTSNITLCASIYGCVVVNVTVQSSSNSGASSSTISFGQANVDLIVGQSKTVPIYGNGGYYISGNSAPSSVSASLNNNNINVTGLAFGGSNINVCQQNGQCAALYAYVAPGSTAAPSSPTGASTLPGISTVTLSSSNTNAGFVTAGNTISISFTANQGILPPTVTVAGKTVAVVGNGAGPYAGNYTVTGSDSLPLPIIISFGTQSGTYGKAYFSMGTSGIQPSSPASTPGTGSSSSASGSNTYTFTRLLVVGSTGADVTALQNRLTADGFYSGPITGKIGYLTQAAVKKYQTKHGLSPVGDVGPATRDLLNKGL